MSENQSSKTKISAKGKGFSFLAKGPALIIRIALCIIGVIAVAIYVPKDSQNMLMIFLLILGVGLVKLLAAEMGFRFTDDEYHTRQLKVRHATVGSVQLSFTF
ncbi:MAG: hypothetical protein HRT38_15365 [Alteromonadaceae bacterium]|nr:hypothetical protein [Alteromonadaceae bacterium]